MANVGIFSFLAHKIILHAISPRFEINNFFIFLEAIFKILTF